MKVILRQLKIKDAPLILEWMHDLELAKNFRQDFSRFTLVQEEEFIRSTWKNKSNLHLAVVDEHDEYLGGISLKHISIEDRNAEYAIAMRKKAIGSNIAFQATQCLLEIAFLEKKLHKIYLNVLSNNVRARKFYEKAGFVYEGESKEQIFINDQPCDLAWYGITANQWQNHSPKVSYQMLEFPQLGDDRGHLVVVESLKNIPFIVKRVFYIYGSDQNVVRGQHANRRSEFVLINVCGTSKVKIDDGHSQTVVELNHPHQGIYLNKMIWKDMFDFSSDSILLCLSSENYDDNEYIRDYQQYLKEVKNRSK